MLQGMATVACKRHKEQPLGFELLPAVAEKLVGFFWRKVQHMGHLEFAYFSIVV